MLPMIIDHDKCKADGICVAVCPRKLIKFFDEESKPRPIPEAAELCFNCGHCLTVCPAGAITIGIPHDHKVYGAMIAGYPKYAYKKIPKRNLPAVVWR